MKVYGGLLMVLLSASACHSGSLELPDGFALQTDSDGGVLLLHDGDIVIHPNIVLIGSNERFIVGCVEGDVAGADIARDHYPGYFIASTRNEPLTQLISGEAWPYFKEKIPEISAIRLHKVGRGECTVRPAAANNSFKPTPLRGAA